MDQTKEENVQLKAEIDALRAHVALLSQRYVFAEGCVLHANPAFTRPCRVARLTEAGGHACSVPMFAAVAPAAVTPSATVAALRTHSSSTSTEVSSETAALAA
jgi:ApbE superfamily uncharacterized protein (UPF0280 family)